MTTESKGETPEERKARLEANAKRITDSLPARVNDPDVPAIEKFRKATKEFFERHWNTEEIGKANKAPKEPPSWQGPAKIVWGVPLPN